MNKILGISLGSLAVISGLILLMAWRSDVLLLLKSSLPFFLIIGGTLAVVAGVSETIDTLKAKKQN